MSLCLCRDHSNSLELLHAHACLSPSILAYRVRLGLVLVVPSTRGTCVASEMVDRWSSWARCRCPNLQSIMNLLKKKNLQSWMLDDFSPSKSSDRDWEMCSRSHLPVVNPCPVYQQDSCCWPSQNLPQLAVLLLQTAVPTFHDMIGSVFTFCCKQITARVKWTWAVINWS